MKEEDFLRLSPISGFVEALPRSTSLSGAGRDAVAISAAPPQLIMKLRLWTMLEGRGSGRLTLSGALSALRYGLLAVDDAGGAPEGKEEFNMLGEGNPNIPGIIGGIIMPRGGGIIHGVGKAAALGEIWSGVVGRP